MKISIKQNKITIFGRKFNVYKRDKRIYSIRRLWYTLTPKFNIKEHSNYRTIGRIENKFLSLRGNAIILVPSGKYKFDQEGIASMKYTFKQIEGGNDEYSILGHKGFECSIYKNGQQIGRWDKNQFVIFDGDRYEIELDDDADIPLIAAMTVLVDTYRISITIGGDIGWEVGNIGKGLKKDRSGWKAKEKTEANNN